MLMGETDRQRQRHTERQRRRQSQRETQRAVVVLNVGAQPTKKIKQKQKLAMRPTPDLTFVACDHFQIAIESSSVGACIVR